jgi:hypothetical protein
MGLFPAAVSKVGNQLLSPSATFVGEAMTKTLTFDKRFDGVRYRDARWKASMRLGTRWIKTWRTRPSCRIFREAIGEAVPSASPFSQITCESASQI